MFDKIKFLFFTFKWRLSRNDFKKWMLYWIILFFVLFIFWLLQNLLEIIILQKIFWIIFQIWVLVLFIAWFSFFIRRLHDLWRPTKDIFLLLIPFYNIYILYIVTQKDWDINENIFWKSTNLVNIVEWNTDKKKKLFKSIILW